MCLRAVCMTRAVRGLEAVLPHQPSHPFLRGADPLDPQLLVRAIEAMFPKDPTPAELPPPLVNQSLIALCRLEHAVLGRLPIPFGSSLLVVGGHR